MRIILPNSVLKLLISVILLVCCPIVSAADATCPGCGAAERGAALGCSAFSADWQCGDGVFGSEPSDTSGLVLPSAEDWVDRGLIFTAGSPGDWDRYLWGAFGMAVLKVSDRYLFYYQGASDFSVVLQSTVGRSVGVAVGDSDLTGFEKAMQNPVLTWHPNCALNDCEEGAVSTAPILLDDGRIAMYYGANTMETAQTVNSDVRLATSTDGFLFDEQGVVLSHTDPSVWGSGDELFAVCAILEGDSIYIYYLPNGVPESRQLGVAWGSSASDLSSTSGVTADSGSVSAWGGMSAVRIDSTSYYLFVNEELSGIIRVYRADLRNPGLVDGPLLTYQLSDVTAGVVHYDEMTRSWLMFYRDQPTTAYGIKTAVTEPVGVHFEHPLAFALELHDNYPDPSGASTNIPFELPDARFVVLELYDVLGKRVKVMLSGVHEAGYHEVSLDVADLPNGIYYYRLQAGGVAKTSKLLVIRQASSK